MSMSFTSNGASSPGKNRVEGEVHDLLGAHVTFQYKRNIDSLVFMQHVVIDQVVEPGTRVTVAMGTNRNLDTGNE